MRWDYLHMIAETMRDLRQEALEADGYVAELRCEDRWQDELDYVRDCIEKSHRNVAKRRAQVARAEEQLARWGTVHGDYWLHNVEFSREWLRRASEDDSVPGSRR